MSDTCEIKTEDGDSCSNMATYTTRVTKTPCCEECVRALIDEGLFDEDDFVETTR